MLRRSIAMVFVSIFCLSCALAGNAAAEEKVVIKFNAQNNPQTFGDMPQVQLNQEFKKEMEKRFPGRVEVRLYWDQRLAKTNDAAINGLHNNVINITYVSASNLSEFTKACIPLTNLFLFPYPHVQIAYDAYDGEVGQMITERMVKELNIRPVAFWESGFRHLLSNKPIHNLADLSGLKYRVQPNPVHIASFKALGANPTPVSWAELFTALQQGVVDGTENPFENVIAGRLYEVQKYMTLTGHVFEMGLYLMNEDFYKGLPADIREGLVSLLKEQTAEYRKRMAKENEEWLKFFKTKMTIFELDPGEMEKFRTAVLPAYDISREQSGKEYANKIFELIKKYESDYFARIKK